MTTSNENSIGSSVTTFQPLAPPQSDTTGQRLLELVSGRPLPESAKLSSLSPAEVEEGVLAALKRLSGEQPSLKRKVMIPGMGRDDGKIYSVLEPIVWDCPPNAIDRAADVIAGAFQAAPKNDLGAALYRLRTLTRSREAQTPEDQTAETTVWLE